MGAVPDKRMTSEEFIAWCAEQDEGRYELVGGEVIAMSPERVRHSEAKAEAWLILRNALKRSAPGCAAYVDGPGIRIDDRTVREPDVLVQCTPADPDGLLLDNPIIVVEVVSPSSRRSDAGAKVAEYFKVPSIRHYLIIDPEGRSVIRHSREGDGAPIRTEIHHSGTIELNPPGIEIATEDIFGSPAPDSQRKGA